MDRIITPAQDLTSASAVFMRFAGFYTGQWGSTASVEVSTDGGSSWTEVMAVDPSEAWQDVVVSLNDYVGMNNVMVAFRHNDNGVWADGFAVDDVEIFEPVAYDVAVNTIDLPAYAAAGNITISGMLTNNGGMTITELQMSYAVDGGSPVTQTVSGLSIAPGATYNLSLIHI